MYKNYFLLLLSLMVMVSSCGKKKKPSLSGQEPVDVKDFITSFELVKPTYEVADDDLNRKENDSLLISYKIFTQFVPDTVLSHVFGKNLKPKLYMLKRVEVEKQETYLFTKAVLADKKVVYILTFDKGNKFAGALPLLKLDANPATTQVCGIDRKYSVFRNITLKKTDGSMSEGKEVYVFNSDAKQFILILTDALDDRATEIINPIDTLSRKNKFSADYVKDKMNLVSIRDGNKPGKINFFIHIEKDNGTCTGEVKGTAILNSAATAVYKQGGDPCSLQFSFTSSSVSLKELEACGSHRGVKCVYDGIYPRKKELKKQASLKRLSK